MIQSFECAHFIMCLFLYSTAEKYIALESSQSMYGPANDACIAAGHTSLAVVDTDERQHMFSLAMAIEYKWVTETSENMNPPWLRHFQADKNPRRHFKHIY